MKRKMEEFDQDINMIEKDILKQKVEEKVQERRKTKRYQSKMDILADVLVVFYVISAGYTLYQVIEISDKLSADYLIRLLPYLMIYFASIIITLVVVYMLANARTRINLLEEEAYSIKKQNEEKETEDKIMQIDSEKNRV